MFESLKRILFRETIDGVNYEVSGLLPHVEDERDFAFQDLGGIFDYKPLHEVHEIKMLSVKDQGTLNTCVWNSYTVAREVSEGIILSPRSIVQFAAKHGYLRGNGFSSIREGQEVGREFGIAEERMYPNLMLDWQSYSRFSLTNAVCENASFHRAKSYFWAKTKSEILKALDENRPIHTGTDWYSSYNMSGGLRAPFTLPWRKGVKVGGHAFTMTGYDLRPGRMVFKFQNSFGKGYGDEGSFYVRIDDWLRDQIPGAVSVDLDIDTLKDFLKRYEGKDVRTVDSPTIYRIEGDVKRSYPDEITFYAWGGRFEEKDRTFEYIAGSLLDSVPSGSPLEPFNSPYWQKLSSHWEKIRWMKSPDNVSLIQFLLQ